MKLNFNEADFLTHCIELFCNEPTQPGRPLMFTTQGSNEVEVLLTADEIESLFLKIQAYKFK